MNLKTLKDLEALDELVENADYADNDKHDRILLNAITELWPEMDRLLRTAITAEVEIERIYNNTQAGQLELLEERA